MRSVLWSIGPKGLCSHTRQNDWQPPPPLPFHPDLTSILNFPTSFSTSTSRSTSTSQNPKKKKKHFSLPPSVVYYLILTTTSTTTTCLLQPLPLALLRTHKKYHFSLQQVSPVVYYPTTLISCTGCYFERRDLLHRC